MQTESGIHAILILSLFSRGFLTLSPSDALEDKNNLLLQMLHLVMDNMELHESRVQAKETKKAETKVDPTQVVSNCTTSADTNQEYNNRKGNFMTQEQVNTLQDNIERVKEYLTYIKRGLAAEKSERVANSKNIEIIVEEHKKSFDDLHKSINHHDKSAKNFFKNLETDRKVYAGKINSHTDKVTAVLIKQYKETVGKEREIEQKLENVAAAIKQVQEDMRKIIPIVGNMLNTNIALGKHATQSSHYDIEYNKGASAATDGRTSGNWIDSSCTHSQAETNPWWQVDLGRTYYIRRVVIKNRSDCCGNQLHNLVISVREEQESTEEICGHFEGPSTNGATETIQCNQTLFGRYLKIQMNAKSRSYLTLCEVEVFGA